MSWSSCSRRAAVRLQLGAGHAVLSSTQRHQAGGLSHASPHPISCSLQHVSGFGGRWGFLTHNSLSTKCPAHDASAQRCFSTRAGGRTVKGPTFMDLFAGSGGFSVAAHKLGYTCVYANDNNPYCVQTYERNHCRGGLGISKVDSRDIELAVQSMSGLSSRRLMATILFAGFPCQPFSIMGKKEGFDCKKHGHLLYVIMELLNHLRNPIVVLENVKSFATNKKFRGLEVVNQEFEALGYYVSTHVYNAVDFNLAQNRERLFIVAVRKDLATGPFEFKEPPSRRPGLALTDFLDPPGPLENPDQYTPCNGVLLPKWTINGKRAGLDWSPGTLEQRTGKMGLRMVGKWKAQGKTEGYKHGRMVFHHSGFAGCMTTRLCNWYQVPGPDGTEDIIRRLSLREALRLQGFPEGFKLPVSDNQAWKQLGNAVAPPIAEWVLRCLQDQYPHILNSDAYSTAEAWRQVQEPESRLSELDEEEISTALKTKLRISQGGYA